MKDEIHLDGDEPDEIHDLITQWCKKNNLSLEIVVLDDLHDLILGDSIGKLLKEPPGLEERKAKALESIADTLKQMWNYGIMIKEP